MRHGDSDGRPVSRLTDGCMHEAAAAGVSCVVAWAERLAGVAGLFHRSSEADPINDIFTL